VTAERASFGDAASPGFSRPFALAATTGCVNTAWRYQFRRGPRTDARTAPFWRGYSGPRASGRDEQRAGISVESTQGETEAERPLANPAAIARAPAERPFADDLVLTRGALAGDEVALACLVRRLACLPRILEALSARLGRPLDEQELEDLSQETLIVAWRKLASFTGEARLETWSYGLARLELMNAIRSKRRRPEFRTEVPRDEPTDVASPPTEGHDRDVLLVEVARLDPDEGEIVRLKHFEDLTFDEIAARLGLTPSTAKTRYYRGVDRLHQRLRGRLGGGLA
jgi:RNA polymerase sigma-70 factor (ECF subfamily)